MKQLETLFDDVIHGTTELLLISGYSGVGKTALVNELGKSIVRGKGYLVQGKFDQYHQSSAYGAFSSAFTGLVQQLLSEPSERLDMWRETLREALGVNGQLVIELVPELELIIGEQPAVQELPPAEAQNRMQILLLNFIKVFASKAHPLVIFLDDLQWSDIPSLNLIQHLVTSRELNHLFMIGAYRSNEVDVSHPLQVRLDQIHQAREFTELALQPLERDAVERMIEDTLHSEQKSLQVLIDLIYEKVQGNPFFMKELLKRLNEDRAIAFSPEKGRWDWDIDVIRQAEVGENVIDFMVASLRRLPEATQHVLQLAACIGNTFDLKTLSIINEQSMRGTSLQLNEALKRNMLIPLNENYKYVGLDSPAEQSNDDDLGAMNPHYKFQHDRMQQAAYALIEPDQKQAVHLAIGRLMKEHGTPQEIEERLIDIVNHLNAGRDLVKTSEESRELARLNLEAGQKAQRSSAYESAYGLFNIAHELLPDAAWQDDYELKLELSTETQQCAYLIGNHAEADEWTASLLEHAHTPLTKAEILSTRTRQYATVGRMQESIQAAIAGLSLLGVELLEAPTPEDIEREIAQVDINLQGREIAELINAPEITEEEVITAIRLLMEIFPAAFLSGSGNLFPYLVLTLVNLSLRHGSSPESAFAYGAYGMLLCGALNDPALGYEYGKLSVAMNERFDDIALRSRIIYVYAMFILHWNEHWSNMTPWFLKCIEAGYQSGDLLYLAYGAQDCIIWDPKLNLETASEQTRKYLAIVRDCKFQDSLDSGTLFLQMQLNFRGLTEDLFSMNDDSFDEQRCVDGMLQRRFMTGMANYHIYKAEIHYFYDDYTGALEHLKDEDHLMGSSMSLPQAVRFRILAFLTQAALYPDLKEKEQKDIRKKLDSYLQQMTMWADNCKENFEHLRLLMLAELARLENRMTDALQCYEQAIAAARESEFRRDEAMANELTAKYLLGIGLTKAAEGYLNAARYLYYRWGAQRKVLQLEQKYPNMLFSRELKQKSSSTTKTQAGHKTAGQPAIQTFVGTTSAGYAELDMNSVIKASQAISGEINIDKLLQTTLQIVLENAGAQKAYYVVRENDKLVIRAQCETGLEYTNIPETPALPEHISAEELLPIAVVNNVIRTGKSVVLDDASESRFANDAYILEQKPKSVICIPIRRHGQFEAVIYMENNLTTDAFTENRIEIVNLLSAQASISMHNAELYENVTSLNEAYERFVPKQFLKLLEKNSITDVELGDYTEREITTLFSDIRAFTSLSESMTPEQNFRFINSYLTRMEPAIHKFNGFIDKYIGDAIMALFPTGADDAIHAAIKMLNELHIY
ncbi:MAG: AAA family ATPase, partial [Gammaproteobacteria bacterium]|nr:AAA family ATPase [Gammaproteobacteria bacterium]